MPDKPIIKLDIVVGEHITGLPDRPEFTEAVSQADLVIDANGWVIKEREGFAGRRATSAELRSAVLVHA